MRICRPIDELAVVTSIACESIELTEDFRESIPNNAALKRVVLDVSDRDKLLAEDLRAIICSRKALEVRGVELTVVCPSLKNREVLKISGLSEMIRVFETLEEAIEAPSNQPPKRYRTKIGTIEVIVEERARGESNIQFHVETFQEDLKENLEEWIASLLVKGWIILLIQESILPSKTVILEGSEIAAMVLRACLKAATIEEVRVAEKRIVWSEVDPQDPFREWMIEYWRAREQGRDFDAAMITKSILGATGQLPRPGNIA